MGTKKSMYIAIITLGVLLFGFWNQFSSLENIKQELVNINHYRLVDVDNVNVIGNIFSAVAGEPVKTEPIETLRDNDSDDNINRSVAISETKKQKYKDKDSNNSSNVTSAVIRDAVEPVELVSSESNVSSGTANGIDDFSVSKKDVVVEPIAKQLLTCDEIQKLEIVRQISRGMSKTVFEIKLPGSRGNAVAKRIHRKKQIPHYVKLFKHEIELMKGLQDRYGEKETLGFLGECNAVSDKPLNKDLLRNFSVGYTSITEMGTPFLLEHHAQASTSKQIDKIIHICYEKFRQCFAKHLTESDIDGLTNIARQYANYSDGSNRDPLILRSTQRDISDNCKIEQYVMTLNGVRHIDLEMVYSCKRCTYIQALEINCSILRILLNNDTLNCNATHTTTTHRKLQRINVTAALEECSGIV